MIGLVVLAGGLGAALRFVVDAWVTRVVRSRVPLGTLLVNVTGSFLLGLVVALSGDHGVGADLRSVVGTGLLGGYTTFSAASVEAVSLARQRGSRALVTATVHAAAMLVCSLLAAGLGLWFGGR
ncbi:fluoride efflux transporter FluC [Aeromicrobium duanguangcaii]|uniref:Fluoride-specific ion channel FluC n=1 Tax=Aeromicrobium duanguangcaii TaxID=2968086 RepID=A0ABY5KH21_9ACTN|nr:CrcB family protein [Aeromicrobium duanguangcaii]MCD9153818.1 CrcB family protein [Aeromicrobium duanguangcaii]MCL3837543.1 CrcB family protein [Aeromicrobium duanguangcaii]UUI69099.1 CrcB family protein [Aeromicrobium duanguangcaii]